MDDVVGAYRVRDQDSDPNVGALARGGTALGTLRAPDNSTSAVTLSWSTTESAWVSPPQTATLELAPAALVDGFGNDNGTLLSTSARR